MSGIRRGLSFPHCRGRASGQGWWWGWQLVPPPARLRSPWLWPQRQVLGPVLALVGGPILGARAGQVTWVTGLILEDIVPGGGAARTVEMGVLPSLCPPGRIRALLHLLIRFSLWFLLCQ